MTDEVLNAATNLRKLVGTNHPIISALKNLFYGDLNNVQVWGLIVILYSKAASYLSVMTASDELGDEIFQAQQQLAEITEMIKASQVLHQSIFNLQPFLESGNELASDDNINFVNKIALLTGDYLLGNASLQLANLRNQPLIELISSAIRDLSESNFIGDRDIQNNPLPFDPRNHSEVSSPEAEWSLRHSLSVGSLLGKSCQGALMLANLNHEQQTNGYLFGKHLALALQAYIDIESFRNSTTRDHSSQFSLISAPVLFHLQHEPQIYEFIKKNERFVDDIDYKSLHQIISEGPGVEKSQRLQLKHSLIALKMLRKFPKSEEYLALEKMILALQSF